MDPTQVAAMLQGGQGGGGAPASPQALATIQNLMKNPGGMGAMQPPPNQMQPPPGQGMNAPLGQMPQQGLAQQQGMGPQGNPAVNQQLMQLLNQQPQPISP
jgi:hypothetical protein